MLGQDAAVLGQAEALIEREWGSIRGRSPDLPFDFTDYYQAEMGPGLVRRWVEVAGMVMPDRLADLKLAAGRMEQEIAVAGRRRVNLDPGLLSLHSFVLATTKDFAHRIYLRDGIYAELTLLYRSGGFEPMEWTYPDYRTAACLTFLAACRAELVAGSGGMTSGGHASERQAGEEKPGQEGWWVAG
jgi:hypothetical protein